MITIKWTKWTPETAFAELRSRSNDNLWDSALDFLLDKKLVEECGCCGGYHPTQAKYIMPDDRFNGGGVECPRDDNNRF